MKIIAEQKEKLNNFISKVENIQPLFMSMYGKYLEEDELEIAKDVINSRTYYIALKEGQKTVGNINFNVEKNSYKMEDYKFIDTRVYNINRDLVIINLSNIENLEESEYSVLCSLMHEIIHTISNTKQLS